MVSTYMLSVPPWSLIQRSLIYTYIWPDLLIMSPIPWQARWSGSFHDQAIHITWTKLNHGFDRLLLIKGSTGRPMVHTIGHRWWWVINCAVCRCIDFW
jgi:hypothetical protein